MFMPTHVTTCLHVTHVTSPEQVITCLTMATCHLITMSLRPLISPLISPLECTDLSGLGEATDTDTISCHRHRPESRESVPECTRVQGCTGVQ